MPAGPDRPPGRYAVSEPVNLAYLIHHYGEAYEVNMRRSFHRLVVAGRS